MMKRILLFLLPVCISAAAWAQDLAGVMAGNPTAMLSHNGQITVYKDLLCFGRAVNAAQDGDTIFFTEGEFLPPEDGGNIRKDITLVGSGRNTHLTGTITYRLSKDKYNHSLTKDLFVDHLSVDQNASENYIDSVTFSNTKIGKLQFLAANGKYYTNVAVNRCEIDSLCIRYQPDSSLSGLNSNPIWTLNAFNSKISTLWGYNVSMDTYDIGMNFVNCNIGTIDPSIGLNYTNNYGITFISCIIDSKSTYSYRSIYQNCLLGSSLFDILSADSKYFTLLGCYRAEGEPLDGNLEVKSGINLESSGYLGVDGTQVGIYGGIELPYSEKPSLPAIDYTKSEVEYDRDASRLKVNITVAE